MTGIERATPYEYEINMIKDDYIDESNYDEWGAAFLWSKANPNLGVEYNIACDTGYNESAIYLTIFDDYDDVLKTDYSIFEPYEINWNDPNWEQKLVKAMWKVFNYFKTRGYYDIWR